jgi:hypothetical protein
MENNKTEVKSEAQAKPKKVAKSEKAAKPATAAPPLTAAQKIEALERSFVAQNNQIEILADEIDRLRNQLVAVNKRLNASIQAAEQGGLTGESVNKIILGENMKELEAKVTFLQEQGVLVRNDDSEISAKTFVVGREVDTEGNVTNPRVQFSVGSVDKAVQEKLYGKKAGAVVAYDGDEDSLEITEVYDIVDPKIKKNFEKQQQSAQ